MKIGIITSSLKLPQQESIRRAAELGADGVQLYAAHSWNGEPTLLDYSDAELAALKELCAAEKLAISAVCADVNNHDFQITGKHMERARFTCGVVDIAAKLGSPVITSHIGVIPGDASDPAYGNMLEAAGFIAEHAAKRNVVMAIETGPESAETLLGFIERVNSPGIGVNLDPANLKMVLNYDPVRAVELLGRYIVHTHAKDGSHYADGSANKAYQAVNADGTPVDPDGKKPDYKEMPLGEGQVDWDPYLARLKEVGFDGFLTIEREVGDDPAADIAKAVTFLKEKLGK